MRFTFLPNLKKLLPLTILVSFVASAFFLPGLAGVSQAQPSATGKTGLPLPRYVSLKSRRVNMRVGPGRQYQVSWLYLKQGLPMEIIQEFDNWRRVRDPQGNEGWVFHSLLSGKRTAIITPGERGADQSRTMLRAEAANRAAVTAEMEAGVVGEISECAANWCQIEVSGMEGFVEKNALWGVYPDENIER